MTREEAELACKRNAESHPDRDTHQWRSSPDGVGGWQVMKIAISPQKDMIAELRADERPPTGDDPRPVNFQNIPPLGGGF